MCWVIRTEGESYVVGYYIPTPTGAEFYEYARYDVRETAECLVSYLNGGQYVAGI